MPTPTTASAVPSWAPLSSLRQAPSMQLPPLPDDDDVDARPTTAAAAAAAAAATSTTTTTPFSSAARSPPHNFYGYDVTVRVLGAAHLPPGDPIVPAALGGSTDAYFILRATPISSREAREAAAAADAAAAALGGGGNLGKTADAAAAAKTTKKKGARPALAAAASPPHPLLGAPLDASEHPPLIEYESAVARRTRAPRWGDAVRLGRVLAGAGGGEVGEGGEGEGAVALELFVFDRDLIARRDDLLCAGGFLLAGPPPPPFASLASTPAAAAAPRLVAVPSLGARLSSWPRRRLDQAAEAALSGGGGAGAGAIGARAGAAAPPPLPCCSSSGDDDDDAAPSAAPLAAADNAASAAPPPPPLPPGEIQEDGKLRVRMTLRMSLPPRQITRERRRRPIRPRRRRSSAAAAAAASGAGAGAAATTAVHEGGYSDDEDEDDDDGDDDDDDENEGDDEDERPPPAPSATRNNTAVAALSRAAAAAAAVAAALPGQARRAVRAAHAEHHAPRLFLELEFSPSPGPAGPPTARAPVRYRQHLMPLADALISGAAAAAAGGGGGGGGSATTPTASTTAATTTTAPVAVVGATFTARAAGIDPTKPRPLATSAGAGVPYFSAYKLHLAGGGHSAAAAFRAAGLAPCDWCPENKGAAQVFQSRALSAALRAKHRLLYSPMLDAPSAVSPAAVRQLLQAPFALLRGAGGGGSSSAAAPPPVPPPPPPKTVKQGTLERGADLTRDLLLGGKRAGEPRYFTWALTMRGAMCFGETGAAALADVLSKHALHSGVARRVRSAGEFCVLPREELRRLLEEAGGEEEEEEEEGGDGGDGGRGMWDYDDDEEAEAGRGGGAEDEGEGGEKQHKQHQQLVLVLDNNSGTYRPPIATVRLTARVLRAQLPGLRVAVVDAPRRPRLLALLHARAPSRLLLDQQQQQQQQQAPPKDAGG
jgi:hypothetical protein